MWDQMEPTVTTWRVGFNSSNLFLTMCFLGIHKVLKLDAQRQFYRLPYLTEKGHAYYLDLLVLRANARLKKRSIFYTFMKALQMHENDPLTDWNPIIPVHEDEEEQENDEEVNDDDEEVDVSVDDWFIYPKDLTYSDDEQDSDFVP